MDTPGARVVRVLCARCDRGLAGVHRDSSLILTDWQNRITPLVEQSITVNILCRDETHGERQFRTSEIVKAARRAEQKKRVQILRA